MFYSIEFIKRTYSIDMNYVCIQKFFRSIALLQMRTVVIINDHSEALELYSLLETTNQFYSLPLKSNVLPPYGGRTLVNIYYLPKTIGIIESLLTVKTNRGTLYYNVNNTFSNDDIVS